MFSPEEIERYARHIVLHGVGGPGQQKLKAARVLVIGAGGLGSPLIQSAMRRMTPSRNVPVPTAGSATVTSRVAKPAWRLNN
jgi:hypothetical protein